MSYKILPNARVLMSTDGTKQLFIDTGHEVVPVTNLSNLYDNKQVGHTDIRIEEVLPRTTHDFQPVEAYGGILACMLPASAALVDKATYTITWNDTVYTCKCDMNRLGNQALLDPSNTATDEPFVCLYDDDQNILLIIAATTGEVTMSISREIVEVHQIDSKYVPINIYHRVTTPVTVNATSGVQLSAEDAAAVEALSKVSNVFALSFAGHSAYLLFIRESTPDASITYYSQVYATSGSIYYGQLTRFSAEGWHCSLFSKQL